MIKISTAKVCKSKGGIWKDKLCFIPSKIIKTGEFVSGDRWKKTDSIKVNNHIFKIGQSVSWEDPDFTAYEDDRYQDFKFMIDSFLIYDKNVEIIPKKVQALNQETGKWEKDLGLGRIPLEDINEFRAKVKKININIWR